MLEELTAAAFEQVIGSRFRVDLGDTPSQELEIVEVQRYKPEWQGPRPEPFSVFLLSSSPWILQQQIYRLEHDTLGQLDLFLVPVAREGQRVRYEAVFN